MYAMIDVFYPGYIMGNIFENGKLAFNGFHSDFSNEFIDDLTINGKCLCVSVYVKMKN